MTDHKVLRDMAREVANAIDADDGERQRLIAEEHALRQRIGAEFERLLAERNVARLETATGYKHGGLL